MCSVRKAGGPTASEAGERRKARIELLKKRLVDVRYIDFAPGEIAAVATLKGESKLNKNPFSLTDRELERVERQLDEIEGAHKKE